MEELHRLGGRIKDADGEPLSGAWIALPDTGRWSASDGGGEFQFARVRAGEHRVLARTADGLEAEATVSVPGGVCDLVAGAPARGKSRR